MQDDLAQMQADLQRVQDEKELKAWLKEQVRARKGPAAYADDFGMHIDDVMHTMMRRR